MFENYTIATTPEKVYKLLGHSDVLLFGASYLVKPDGSGILYCPDNDRFKSVLSCLNSFSFDQVFLTRKVVEALLARLKEQFTDEEKRVIVTAFKYMPADESEVLFPFSLKLVQFILSNSEIFEDLIPEYITEHWIELIKLCETDAKLWFDLSEICPITPEMISEEMEKVALSASQPRDPESVVTHEYQHHLQDEKLTALGFSVQSVKSELRQVRSKFEKDLEPILKSFEQIRPATNQEKYWYGRLLKLGFEFQALKECDAIMAQLEALQKSDPEIARILYQVAEIFRVEIVHDSEERTRSWPGLAYIDGAIGPSDRFRDSISEHVLGVLTILFGDEIFSELDSENYDLARIVGDIDSPEDLHIKSVKILAKIFVAIQDTYREPTQLLHRCKNDLFKKKVIQRMIKARILLDKNLEIARVEAPGLFSDVVNQPLFKRNSI